MRCDNPPCVNPAHLTIGTHAENMARMLARGRSHRGSRRSKRLTERDVVAMREAAAIGAKSRDLAAQYGVKEANVCMIIRGHRWRHAGGPITQKYSTQKVAKP